MVQTVPLLHRVQYQLEHMYQTRIPPSKVYGLALTLQYMFEVAKTTCVLYAHAVHDASGIRACLPQRSQAKIWHDTNKVELKRAATMWLACEPRKLTPFQSKRCAWRRSLHRSHRGLPAIEITEAYYSYVIGAKSHDPNAREFRP